MTSVLISHNPFRTETEILIDEQPITDTSVLFKYLRTPMQDWVGDFLPSLIADCNDDELEITFRGLPYHYEDLKAELDKFLRENMDYDIELSFDACEDQTARLNTLNDILNEIKTQDTVEELKDPDFTSSLDPTNNRLAVLILGGSNSQQEVLVNGLFGPGVYNPQTDIQNILLDVNHQFAPSASDSPPGLESLETIICSDDKPIVICLLDNQLKRSRAGFLDIIAAQHRTRGKQNKQRFIFVAETPALAKRTLHSEFSIKNTFVYAFDETALMQKKIEEYLNEVSLIRYLVSENNIITQYLNILEDSLSTRAKESIDYQKVDRLEVQALTLLNNSELVSPVADTSGLTDLLINKLCSEFNELKTSIIGNSNMTFAGYRVKPKYSHKQAIKTFIESLPTRIEQKLNVIDDTIYKSPAHVNIPPNLYYILEELGCINASALLQELKENIIVKSSILLDKGPYMNRIQLILFGQNPTLSVDLTCLCWRCLHDNFYFTKSELDECCSVFQENIEKIRPIIKSYLDALSTSSADVYFQIYDQALVKIEEAIHESAKTFRKTAKISSDALIRLQYIQSIKERITKLTCLRAGES